MTSHANDKNFVGLSATSDFITCGSENNSVYAYYKALSKPVVSYRFQATNPVTGAVPCAPCASCAVCACVCTCVIMGWVRVSVGISHIGTAIMI